MFGDQPADQVLVQRLGEAGIGDRGREPPGRQLVGSLQAFLEACAEAQYRHRRALAHHPALADLQGHAPLRQLEPDTFAARIAQGARPIVDLYRGRHHVHQLHLVRRRHHHEAGQASQIGDVVGAGMGRAVGADQPRPVDGETHRQALDRNIVHDLVVGPLQEGRVDRGKGLHPLRDQPAGEGHRVLLGDADVETALGKALGEQVEPGARWHRRGDRDDLVVDFRFLDERLGEHLGVARRFGLGLHLGSGDHIELGDAVIFVGRGFGGRIALALFRYDVDQDRTRLLGIADVLQYRQQVIDVVAVDGSDVEKAELLEQGAAGDQAAGVFLGALGRLFDRARELLGQLAPQMAHRAIGLGGDESGKIRAHRAHRWRDRHVIVVEDNDQPGVHGAGVVHGFVGHARAHGAVADYGDHAVVATLKVPRDGHAEGGRDRR